MKKVILTRVAANDFVFLPSDNFICAQQISATKGYLSFAPTIDYTESEVTLITFNFTDDAAGANVNFKNIVNVLSEAIAFGKSGVITFADVIEGEYLHTSGSAGGANMVATNLAITLNS